MTGDDRPTMPPVRLSAEAELARDALVAPLLSRAVALARWAGKGVRLTVAGELPEPRLREAADHLGLGGGARTPETDETDEAAGAVEAVGATESAEAAEAAALAWHVAVETGLVRVAAGAGGEDGNGNGGEDGPGGFGGGADLPGDGGDVATTGDAVELLASGGPADVLELWRDVWEVALARAGAPSFADVMAAVGPAAEGAPAGPEEPDWDPHEAADVLDAALANLYLLTAEDPAVAEGAMVPLPVLAASLVVPDDMEHPTDAVLEDVSEVMMRLDEQLRLLEPAGAVEYRPVDEALLQEAELHEAGLREAGRHEAGDDHAPAPVSELADEELSRYGMVRFTPLGLYGERSRLLDAGTAAPAVGDLADADAPELLTAVSPYPEALAQAELEQWLAGRGAPEAARALLDASRGRDEAAPRRRLLCQQGLAAAGPGAEPALRAVLDDPELGGLARVWLAERGAADVPPPDEELIFWLTVDTLAAQLDPEDPGGGTAPELSELMAGLVAQHSGFFDKAWRVDHPATARVLEAMARLHPDRAAAKAARKAAYKARSRPA
ncbi:hypothetical protein WDH52_02420 [Streptomyces sp. TRM70308]|uniref:hypothetical protein n=1 Tax=Streptomyces sp. TRM70308 TaxID=3131932 RepID=UPI003D06BAE6